MPHPVLKLGVSPFPDHLTPDLGVALMNLYLRGCASVEAAAALRFLGLIRPTEFVRVGPDGHPLGFVAVELEFSADLEIGDILLARATRHRFIEEAFARMQTDQYTDAKEVVFERKYLESLTPEALAATFRRSASGWQHL